MIFYDLFSDIDNVILGREMRQSVDGFYIHENNID